MSNLESNQKDLQAIASMGYEFYFKIILFIVAVIAFIVVTGTLIYMALMRYEAQAILAFGASDGIIGLVIGRITRSLFRTS